MKPFALLSLLLLAGAAFAGDAACSNTVEAEVDTGETPAGRFYVDNDFCQPGCLFSVWVYQESNGYDGLQRSDETLEWDPDSCPSDTILF